MCGLSSTGIPCLVPTEAGAGVWGESTMVAPPLVHHSAMAPCFKGSLHFLQEHSWLQSPSLLSSQAVFTQVSSLSHPLSPSSYSQQQSSPWVHSPNSMLQYSAPISSGGCTSQAGACRAVAQTIGASLPLSCPTQSSCCTFF